MGEMYLDCDGLRRLENSEERVSTSAGFMFFVLLSYSTQVLVGLFGSSWGERNLFGRFDLMRLFKFPIL